MKVGRRHPVTLGGADCRLLRYEVLPPRKHPDGGAPGKQPRAAAARNDSSAVQPERKVGTGV